MTFFQGCLGASLGYVCLLPTKAATDDLAVGSLAPKLLVDLDRGVLGGIRTERTGLEILNPG
jgi:hypothetical protein